MLLSLQKCLKFNVDAPIWLSKQQILCSLNQSLKDVLNYGLFQPAYNGRAGKFLDEERQLREYPFPTVVPVPYLEVRMRRCRCMYKFRDQKWGNKRKMGDSFSDTQLHRSGSVTLHCIIFYYIYI